MRAVIQNLRGTEMPAFSSDPQLRLSDTKKKHNLSFKKNKFMSY